MDTLSSYQYTGEKDPYNANAFKVTSCYLSSFGDNFLSTKTPLGSARHYDMPIQQDRYSSEPHDVKCVDGLHPRLMLKILHQHGYVCKTLTSLVFLSKIFWKCTLILSFIFSFWKDLSTSYPRCYSPRIALFSMFRLTPRFCQKRKQY